MLRSELIWVGERNDNGGDDDDDVGVWLCRF